MSWLPLFPELAMISRQVPRRKPVPKQLVLFPNPNYARYTLKLKQQTPKWADKKAVAALYRAARRLTRETGELYVVDHIVPSTGASCVASTLKRISGSSTGWPTG